MLAQAVLEQALDGLRLLGDLLGHEVRVAAERRCRGVPVDVESVRVLDWVTVCIKDLHPAGTLEQGKLAVIQGDDMRCDRGERRDVGGGIGSVLGAGHDKRRTLAGDGHLVGRIGTDDGDGVGAREALGGVAEGAHEVAPCGTLPSILDKVGDDLGVRVGDKRVTVAREIGAQLGVVLDDAVVHDGDATRAVQVRVSVAVGGGAMGGPTRMRDARGTHGICRLAAIDERLDAARALHAVEVARRRDDLDARRVIASVLKRLQALEQELLCLVLAGVCDDSAHDGASWCHRSCLMVWAILPAIRQAPTWPRKKTRYWR